MSLSRLLSGAQRVTFPPATREHASVVSWWCMFGFFAQALCSVGQRVSCVASPHGMPMRTRTHVLRALCVPCVRPMRESRMRSFLIFDG